jgi:hypothetical protein
VRSIVKFLDDNAASRLELIRWCPVQFQRYIEGVNIRVHTVAGEVFATRIDTDRVDYRYATSDGGYADLKPSTLPDDTAARCLALAAGLGLELAGIDLIVTDDGEVFCLEVNPGPAFSYYEANSGQEISRAIAHALGQGESIRPWPPQRVSARASATVNSAEMPARATERAVSANEDVAIDDLCVYDKDEAATIADRIEALRDRWLHRSAGLSTVGIAAYIDVMCSDNPERDYYARRDEQNELLMNHFADILEDVGVALARHLGESVRFDSAVALPGFHIFEEIGIAVSSLPSQHFDLQHRGLHWPFEVSEDRLLSFTLAIKLPSLGGGLQYWDITERGLVRQERFRGLDMEQLGSTEPTHFHPYSPGVMAVQMVPVMHRIAPISERFPGDQRITLQGHAVHDGTAWVLYW